jgi:hypothetical protein
MSPEPSGFGATLRFELASDEGRPLFVSYVIASLLALTWLTLVHVMPGPFDGMIVVAEPPLITFDPEVPAPPSRSIGAPAKGLSPTGSPGAGSIRGMFSPSTGLVDAGNILRGVDVSTTGSGAGEPTVGKVGLETGAGSLTPGRSRHEGLSATGAGVGAVRGAGVSRTAVTIAPPEVRPTAPGTPVGNASEVGQMARAHAPQLARCYHDEGLTRNASLAGLVRLALYVEGGRVTSAQIVDRSWAGAGAAETEGCLLRSVRGWRLGSSNARVVLPLSFTSAHR